MFGLNKKLSVKNSTEKPKINGVKSKNNKSTSKSEASKENVKIPDLICKSYVDGCLVLGCIHDIKNSELVVSLPGIGNFGYVKINNISNIYTELIKSDTKASNVENELKTLLDMYNKGDMIRCKVLSYTDKKLILTIDPEQVNNSLSFRNLHADMIISGAVKTKEDHGYTIDLGIESLTGFYKTESTNATKLALGQTCLFKIGKKPTTRAINLNLCHSQMGGIGANQGDQNLFYDLNSKTQFDSFLPGALINGCAVDKISKNGIQVNISNSLIGFIHVNHVPPAKRPYLFIKKDELGASNKKPAYENGDRLNGTIIFINPYSKVVYLSLLPHLVDSTKTAKILADLVSEKTIESNLKLGQILNEVQVNTHTYKGIYVKFNVPNSTRQIIGFIPKRHLIEADATNESDDDDDEDEDVEDGIKLKKQKQRDAKNMSRDDIEKLFPLNHKIKARIYDFSLIEDIILLSCRKSILNATFMNYDELKIGQVVSCTVKSINSLNGGVTVALSPFVNGFIPKIHTGDVPLSENMLPRKLKIGTEIKCKIIQLNTAEKRCVLTAKKTLIKSKLTLIHSFEQLSSGMETYGVVVSIQSYGLLLGFLNDLKGLLPRQQLSTSSLLKNPNQDLKELYYLGQLIKCKVLDFDRKKEQIKLSLIMDSNKAVLNKEKSVEKSQEEVASPNIDLEYEIGDRVETSTILQVNEDQSYFRLKLPRGSKNGILYKNHLSDLECLNDALFDFYKQSMKIPNLMVTQLSSTFSQVDAAKKKKSCHFLTGKQTLIDFYSKLKEEDEAMICKSFHDLKVNTWFHAWIRKVLDNGLLVEMPYDLVGFCTNKSIKYLSEMKATNLNGICAGQSVLIKIGKLFDEKERFLANVKSRFDLIQKNQADLNYMIQLFKSYFTNMNKIFKIKVGVDEQKLSGPFNSWHKSISSIQLGSVINVAIRSLNKASGQIECLFLNDQNEINQDASSMIGYAFADPEDTDLKIYSPGTKFQAMVLAFDPIARAFCLTINKKHIKAYLKNFDSKFRSLIKCKLDQSVKAQVVYVSQWFCIVGLKAHALGLLAFLPLFRNDFTQLNTFNAAKWGEANKYEQIDSKIKQKQVLAVSSASMQSLSFDKMADEHGEKLKQIAKQTNKQDKRFSYLYVDQIIKVLIKNEIEDGTLIVVRDLSSVKRNKKQLMRQISILNEIHTDHSDGNVKRKQLNGNDQDVVIVKKKLVEKQKKRKLEKEDTEKDSIEIVTNVKKLKLDTNEEVPKNDFAFPWEVKDFDQFERVLMKTKLDEDEEEESVTANDQQQSKPKAKKIKQSKVTMENASDQNGYESTESYETLVTASPNSSANWIKYMNFFLKMAEVEKARGVANRGLKTIFYRDDAERLNMWIALLSFECNNGTQSTLDDAFNRATQNCDSFKIHSHMAEIYIKANKLQEAEAIYMKMARKFSKSPEVWIKYGIFHYRNLNCELARKLLIKSFNSLDQPDHVEMVNKFAQLEFKYGDVERAKTMYDTLLFTYQNRTDIWSVYIDMLIKHERYDDARQVFNRIIQLGLTVKRMKFIFKKFIDFEHAHGNDETVAQVKELATKYAEKNEFVAEKEMKEDGKSSISIEKNLKRSLNI